jgi:hypothetical protein
VPLATFSAPLATCAPYVQQAGEERSRLIDVSRLVDAVVTAKQGRKDRVVVSTIVGWSDDPAAQYTITPRPSARGGFELDLGPICQQAGTGTATPALRLHAFANAFPHHTVHSICSDLDRAMGDIGAKIVSVLSNP